MPAIITVERSDTSDASALITELEETLEPLYPQESRHGLSIENLRADGMTAGCGGVKLFDTAYGEIKRCMCDPSFADEDSPS